MINAIKNISNQLLIRQRIDRFGFIKGAFLAVVWQLYKRLIGFPIIVNTYRNGSFILRPTCITSSRFVYEGNPDKKEIDILSSFGGKDVVFVDVGANVGLYSVLLCADFNKAVLFEPNPVAARMLKQNLAVNEKLDDYIIYEAAVGSEKGKVSFPILDTPLPTAKVSVDHSENMIERDLYRLDDVLSSGLECVVKIDAEGFDDQVILGLQENFKAQAVKICLFECHDLELLEKVYDFLLVGNSFAYCIYDGANLIEKSNNYSAKKNRDLFIVRNDLVNTYLKSLGQLN